MKIHPLRALSGVAVLSVVFLSGCADFTAPLLGLGDQGNKDGFGAVAFSSTTQRWHIRWNVSDQARAEALATQYCGADDCSVVLRFGPGQCGTFSLGDAGALGIGLGESEAVAGSTARDNCALSGQSCKVAPVRCNDSVTTTSPD